MYTFYDLVITASSYLHREGQPCGFIVICLQILCVRSGCLHGGLMAVETICSFLPR
jgi:hypothetical protein